MLGLLLLQINIYTCNDSIGKPQELWIYPDTRHFARFSSFICLSIFGGKGWLLKFFHLSRFLLIFRFWYFRDKTSRFGWQASHPYSKLHTFLPSVLEKFIHFSSNTFFISPSVTLNVLFNLRHFGFMIFPFFHYWFHSNA